MEKKTFPRCDCQEELCRREKTEKEKKKWKEKVGNCETCARTNSSSKYFNTVTPWTLTKISLD